MYNNFSALSVAFDCVSVGGSVTQQFFAPIIALITISACVGLNCLVRKVRVRLKGRTASVLHYLTIFTVICACCWLSNSFSLWEMSEKYFWANTPNSLKLFLQPGICIDLTSAILVCAYAALLLGAARLLCLLCSSGGKRRNSRPGQLCLSTATTCRQVFVTHNCSMPLFGICARYNS